ncbi:hypothetical protein SCUCBS95973_005392 [Sporothrix curviconia]|uniref:C2H2-type domain-containing protein n=1 Tax=Sporothrix curviconia TaxID=1260050 RepID=A0ABP0BYF5_9PEZI
MDDDAVFQCYECADGVQIFATEEALITHKWDMIRASKRKTHMCCHVCKLDHRTFEGLVRHYQLSHPAKQKLQCPGCRMPFARLYQLMHHLDSDACPHILASRVSENRVLQVQATNLVAAAAATAAIEGSTEDGLLGGPPAEAGSAAAAAAAAGGAAASAADQVPTGMAAIDAVRSAQLGIYDTSGVTLGDFGRFVGIDPETAAAAVAYETAAAAAAGVGGAGWGLSVGLGGPHLHGHGGVRGDEVLRPPKQEAPLSSSDAIKHLMSKRQQQHQQQMQQRMGAGGGVDPYVNANANANAGRRQDKGKGKEVAVDKGRGKPEESWKVGAAGPSNSSNYNYDKYNSDESELDKKRNATAAAVAMARAVRDFRHGDSKAPDLLTDDVTTVNQRFQGLNVWAGQEMLEAEPVRHGGPVSGGAVPLRDDAASAAGVAGTAGASTRGLGSGLSAALDTAGLSNMAGQANNNNNKDKDKDKDKDIMGRAGFQTLKEGAASQYMGFRQLHIDHPDHPHFNIFRYKNKINGHFHCPHEMCWRAGKVFKTAGSLLGHLRNEAVHSTLRVQCPSCFGYFTSVNALTQHCESQSSRCQFRESDDYLPFLNILTAGVAEVQGRNIDMTLAYNVQPTAAPALLQGEIYQGETAEQSKAIW